MKVVVERPHFLPRLYRVQRIALADIYVIRDDGFYKTLDWQRRTTVKTPEGVRYLTVGVNKGTTDGLVKDVMVRDDWQDRMLAMVRAGYRRARHFDEMMSEFESLLYGCSGLFCLNRRLLLWLFRGLGIGTRVVSQSYYGEFSQRKADLMLAVTVAAGGDAYVCGQSGIDNDFYDLAKFREAGVAIETQDWTCPEYPQLWGDFVPNLSVLDALMNVGWKGTREVLGLS